MKDCRHKHKIFIATSIDHITDIYWCKMCGAIGKRNFLKGSRTEWRTPEIIKTFKHATEEK